MSASCRLSLSLGPQVKHPFQAVLAFHADGSRVLLCEKSTSPKKLQYFEDYRDAEAAYADSVVKAVEGKHQDHHDKDWKRFLCNKGSIFEHFRWMENTWSILKSSTWAGKIPPVDPTGV